VRYKLVWPLAGLACAIVLAGMGFLWKFEGQSIGISVGLPVGATLLAPIIAWAISAQSQARQSTPEQLRAAKELLAALVLEDWRGIRRPTGADLGWRPTSGTLAVRWAASTPDAVDDTARNGTDDVTTMAARLRGEQCRRLIMLGEADSGKTVLARSLMVEFLEHPQPGDPVPVFLPITAWNPDQRGLSDWMVQRIGADAPELREESSYGPTAIASLVGLGMVLPILDGLDALPKASRLAVLTSDDLLRRDRLVITCRTPEFKEVAEVCAIPDTVVLTPGRVGLGEAKGFLDRAAGDPQRWESVFNSISDDPSSQLADALGNPRIIYLASAVYKDPRNRPDELVSDHVNSEPGFVESYLLRRLLPALMPADGSWAPECPWYRDEAMQWLEYLNGKVRDPRTGGIAWWNVFKATPLLYRFQGLFRALSAAVIVFAVNALMYKGSQFGVLTGIAYAFALFATCIFLSPVDLAATPEFKRPAVMWRIRRMWVRSWRVLAAGFVALCGFGTAIGYRTASEYGFSVGVRTGRTDGLIAASTIVVGAIIAGLPAQPRSQQTEIRARQREVDVVAGRSATVPPIRRSISSALALGIVYGLLVAILTATKHQYLTGTSNIQALRYGLIIGINFAVGAWLVNWARIRLSSSDAPDPISGFRADRAFALLAIAILGVTFASAFGLDSGLHWDLRGAVTNGMAGIIAGSLASEWLVYVTAITLLAIRRQLPLRFMKFLKICYDQTVLRPVLQSFQFREDPARTLPAAGEPRLVHAHHPHELPGVLPRQRRPPSGPVRSRKDARSAKTESPSVSGGSTS
jgi:Na+-translocating ferredoxin:NAD+ oxidoreductase RnfA subunit